MKDANQNEQSPEELPSPLAIDPESADKNCERNTGENTEPASPVANSSPAILPTEPSKDYVMDIHHHGHVHEQKKWKEYVFQFFMLFLAVFCGFLAEYQLEQTIERHREKEFIESFVNDLKLDTAQMQLRSRDITNAIKGIDSLLAVSKDLNRIENVRMFCYYYIKYVPASQIFLVNDGTMLQLKNAGGLRLIRNREAVDSIMIYDSYSRRIEAQGARYRDNVAKGLDASDYVFDWTTFDGVDLKSLLTSETVSLANPTKEQLQYFINRVLKQKGVSIFYQRYLQDQYRRATRMIPFLQKEYKL